MTVIRARAVAVFACLALLVPNLAQAADFPTRPIRWIVPYPAGGTTDILSRIMADFLAQRLGQPVVIENKPGAANNIATQAVISAPPDGHTILLTATTNAINATFYEKLPFNFLRDIAPVGGFVTLPFVLIATPAFPAKTVPELVTYAKANPGKVNMGSFGTGTSAIWRSNCSSSRPAPTSCTCHIAAACRWSPTCSPAGCRPASTPCRIRCSTSSAVRFARSR